jgi:sister-chromatid-cohesion protein PDS5
VEDDDVSLNLRAKILSLKVYRNRSLAHASSDAALEISTPVLKMLTTLLDHSGSFTADAAEEYVPFAALSSDTNRHHNYSPKVMSRMRLQAAVSLLHLSTVPIFANAISPKFLRLAISVQVGVLCSSDCVDVLTHWIRMHATTSGSYS